MTVRKFASFLSHEMFDDNFSNIQGGGVNMTVPFLLVAQTSDCGSFEINCSPRLEVFPERLRWRTCQRVVLIQAYLVYQAKLLSILGRCSLLILVGVGR